MCHPVSHLMPPLSHKKSQDIKQLAHAGVEEDRKDWNDNLMFCLNCCILIYRGFGGEGIYQH